MNKKFVMYFTYFYETLKRVCLADNQKWSYVPFNKIDMDNISSFENRIDKQNNILYNYIYEQVNDG